MNTPLKVSWWPNLADVVVLVILIGAQLWPTPGGLPRTEPFTVAGIMFVVARLLQLLLWTADWLAGSSSLFRAATVAVATVTIGVSGWLLWQLTGPVAALGFCWWLRTAVAKTGLRLADLIGWTRAGADGEVEPQVEQQVQRRLGSNPMFDVPVSEPPAFRVGLSAQAQTADRR